jgi:dTDP-4-amino-4,6-dideoxygalactose transaminase
VPVHLYGNPVDFDKFAALRKDFDLGTVEDSAQAIGADPSVTEEAVTGVVNGCNGWRP